MGRGERKRKPTEKMALIETEKTKDGVDEANVSEKRPRRHNGIAIPRGSKTQQNSSDKLFDEYLESSNMTWTDVKIILKKTQNAEQQGDEIPRQSSYTILEGFVRFLYNYEAKKTRNKENVYTFKTADSYFSQAKMVIAESWNLNESRCKKIRSKLKKVFLERDTMLSISTQQAPAATVNDLKILAKILHTKGDIESVQFQAMLVLQWHMLGRSIDCCWIKKKQVVVTAGGDLFISFSRLKTSSLQGISLFQAKHDWEMCPVLALAVAFITATHPSEFVFNHLNLHKLEPNVPQKLGVVSQLEGTVLGAHDDTSDSAREEEVTVRKRPSAAQFTNSRLQQLQKIYSDSKTQDTLLGDTGLTSNLQSHSLRRGAAQHANSSSKIPIQWLCTRGNWMMDSLSKAFAYIGTTLEDDRRVAKRLSSWDPDEETVLPSVSVLLQICSAEDAAKLHKVQRLLYEPCRGFPVASGVNIGDAVMHVTFAMLLIHCESILQYKTSVLTQKIYRVCVEANCDVALLIKAGGALRSEALLPRFDQAAIQSARNNESEKLEKIEQKLDRVSNEVTYLRKQNEMLIGLVRRLVAGTPVEGEAGQTSNDGVHSQETSLSSVVRMNIPISSFLYCWYTSEPWKLPRATKKDQDLMSDICCTIAILKISFGQPINIPRRPNCEDLEALGNWKEDIRQLGMSMMQNFNTNMRVIDRKKDTMKASGVRGRFQKCHQQSTEFVALIRKFAVLRAQDMVVDHATPPQHQKEGSQLIKLLPLLHDVPLAEDDEM